MRSVTGQYGSQHLQTTQFFKLQGSKCPLKTEEKVTTSGTVDAVTWRPTRCQVITMAGVKLSVAGVKLSVAGVK